MNINDLLDGFYENDFTDKSTPRWFTELRVEAFEMRPLLTKMITTCKEIKTGYRGKRGSMFRKYFIFYKEL